MPTTVTTPLERCLLTRFLTACRDYGEIRRDPGERRDTWLFRRWQARTAYQEARDELHENVTAEGPIETDTHVARVLRGRVRIDARHRLFLPHRRSP